MRSTILSKETVEISMLDLDGIADALRVAMEHLEITEASKIDGKESYLYRKLRLALETATYGRRT